MVVEGIMSDSGQARVSVDSEGVGSTRSDPGPVPADNDQEPLARERRNTAYQRLSHDLSNDQRCLKEITLGKRIGFYRIRGELGTGNFSQVKMGIHALTKGRPLFFAKLRNFI